MTQMKQYTQYIHKDNEWRVLGGAGSDNADWNQNDDTKSDYIKNRTHYITTEEIEDVSLNFYHVDSINNIYNLSGTIAKNILYSNKPEEGKNFKITLNEITFNEPWIKAEEIYFEGYTVLYIGNLSLCWYFSDDPSLDTGEDYLFLYMLDTFGLYSGGSIWLKGSFISNISGDEYKLVPSTIYLPNYHKIDSDFLPYEVGEGAEVFNNLITNAASGEYSHAEGSWTTTIGEGSHAEGCQTVAQGDYSHAEGYYSENLFNYEEDISQVYNNPFCFQFQGGEIEQDTGWIYNSNNQLIGKNLNFGSYGNYSNVYWMDEENIINSDLYYNLKANDTIYIRSSGAYGNYSHTEGYQTRAAEGAHAEGQGSHADGVNSHAEGYETSAIGQDSHAEGSMTSAQGNYSHSEGYSNYAGGTYSHVEGYGNYAHLGGNGTHVEGNYSMGVGNYSHAEGLGNSSGLSATIQSINQNNTQITVSGLSQISGGYVGCLLGTSSSTSNRGNRILASSYNTANNYYTFTMSGWATSYTVGRVLYLYQVVAAIGEGSHAEGGGTTAVGIKSHAEGSTSISSGFASHAEGAATEAKGNYQHVQGKYNIIDNNNTYADIVGNGSSSARSNAYTLDWNGNGVYAGKVTVGSGPVNDMDLATKKYIDDNFMSGMTILSYGSSTWDDFIAAYTAQRVVYCRASSNSNPASGSQTRLAFMAYVNNAQNPTEVEFQYYRSVSSHSETQQGDQVYVYKLNQTNGWSVTTRECYTKVVGGTDITGTWSNGTLTLDHDNSGVTAGTYKSVTVDATGHVTGGSNPTTLSGYGITDAKIASGVITLGSNTITPLTSSSTLDASKLNGAIANGVTATTQSANDNSTKVATTAYVDNAVASITPTIPNASSTTVGGIKMRLDTNTNTLYITNNGNNA